MRLGIDLGGTNINMGLVKNGQVIRSVCEPCKGEGSEQEVVNHMINMAKNILSSDVKGIGIGVPSVVDTDRGIVYNVANIPSWQEVHLKDIFEKEFRLPVVVNNDCNCFALGQHLFGIAKSYNNVVCLTLGTGVGAGIIIDNKLYNGSNTGAGEIGCLPYLDSDYEHYCASTFLQKASGQTAKKLYDNAKMGDKKSLKLWAKMGTHFGNLIKVILYTYDPQAIVIGGGIAKAFEFFSPSMYESMQRFPYLKTVERINIHVADNDLILQGAAALIEVNSYSNKNQMICT